MTSIAFDPGSVPGTGLLRDMPALVRWLSTTPLMTWVSRRMGVTTSDVEFSGASLAALTVDPEYGTRSGEYFQAHDGTLSAVRSSQVSYDTHLAAQLWHDSEQLVHLTADETPASLR